ncbi:MAG: hypothetical protein KVP17_002319 [Porospora cf. gigantea B]|nr:MAG: hypothetical protein KVP17_002319 [Porospora cf. gigantea B]
MAQLQRILTAAGIEVPRRRVKDDLVLLCYYNLNDKYAEIMGACTPKMSGRRSSITMDDKAVTSMLRRSLTSEENRQPDKQQIRTPNTPCPKVEELESVESVSRRARQSIAGRYKVMTAEELINEGTSESEGPSAPSIPKRRANPSRPRNVDDVLCGPAPPRRGIDALASPEESQRPNHMNWYDTSRGGLSLGYSVPVRMRQERDHPLVPPPLHELIDPTASKTRTSPLMNRIFSPTPGLSPVGRVGRRVPFDVYNREARGFPFAPRRESSKETSSYASPPESETDSRCRRRSSESVVSRQYAYDSSRPSMQSNSSRAFTPSRQVTEHVVSRPRMPSVVRADAVHIESEFEDERPAVLLPSPAPDSPQTFRFVWGLLRLPLRVASWLLSRRLSAAEYESSPRSPIQVRVPSSQRRSPLVLCNVWTILLVVCLVSVKILRTPAAVYCDVGATVLDDAQCTRCPPHGTCSNGNISCVEGYRLFHKDARRPTCVPDLSRRSRALHAYTEKAVRTLIKARNATVRKESLQSTLRLSDTDFEAVLKELAVHPFVKISDEGVKHTGNYLSSLTLRKLLSLPRVLVLLLGVGVYVYYFGRNRRALLKEIVDREIRSRSRVEPQGHATGPTVQEVFSACRSYHRCSEGSVTSACKQLELENKCVKSFLSGKDRYIHAQCFSTT